MPNMIASALAEEMFFLQMEEDATFITSTLEVIQSLELKYSTLPVITELDKMDEDQPSKLDIMDQSSPKPGHGDAGPRSEQQSTWPVTLHYSRPSSHEGARVMVACWMVPR